jgi:hypothetical protein
VRRWDALGQPARSGAPGEHFTAQERFDPSIAALPGGGFVVVWTGFGADDPDSYGIFGQRFDATDTPVGTEFRVNTVTADTQPTPSVAAAPTGGFVVVWNRSYKTKVVGQLYDASGVAVGGEFEASVDYQASSPNVAMGAERRSSSSSGTTR